MWRPRLLRWRVKRTNAVHIEGVQIPYCRYHLQHLQHGPEQIRCPIHPIKKKHCQLHPAQCWKGSISGTADDQDGGPTNDWSSLSCPSKQPRRWRTCHFHRKGSKGSDQEAHHSQPRSQEGIRHSVRLMFLRSEGQIGIIRRMGNRTNRPIPTRADFENRADLCRFWQSQKRIL